MAKLTWRIIGPLILLTISAGHAYAKAWRGVTPLKSTQADVERLFGKPNDLGRYEIQGERAYIFYSDGPCDIDPESLAKVKCECLVTKGTVLRIAVTLERETSFRLEDKNKFTKALMKSDVRTSTYSDLDDGIVYTVRGADERLIAVDYWPSISDCNEILQLKAGNRQRKAWRSIRPLFSTKSDVENLLGQPKWRSVNDDYVYETAKELVRVLYAERPCEPSIIGNWDVASNTVLRITVIPQKTLLIKDLNLDRDAYRREPDPNIPNAFFWVNLEEGIIIESELRNNCEQVVTITYRPSNRDKNLLCK
jgi:hypothetical protein